MSKVDKKKVDTKYGRFKDIEWFGHPLDIVIGGVGGIGSWFSILVARTGEHTLQLYDIDTVERSNLAGQFYTESDIGLLKVEAVKRNIHLMAGNDVNIYACSSKFTNESPGDSVMVSCFDNMKAREDMFNVWRKTSSEGPKLFMDGRMNAENFQMFMVTPENEDQYLEHLFPDSELEDLPCTYKATSHTAAMMASKMVTGLTNWVGNNVTGKSIRSTPFKYDYDMQFLMETKYENILTNI